jgi:hypothetical protein
MASPCANAVEPGRMGIQDVEGWAGPKGPARLPREKEGQTQEPLAVETAMVRRAHSDAWAGGIPDAMSDTVYGAILLDRESPSSTGGSGPSAGAGPKEGEPGTAATRCLGRALQVCRPEGAASLSPAQACLREDFSREKVRWYGSWWYDHLLYMRLNNPVLSLRFAHPLHPVTRKERWLLLIVQLFFSVLLACAFTEAAECVSCGIYDCDISVDESFCVLTGSTNETRRRVLLGAGGGTLVHLTGPRGVSRRMPRPGERLRPPPDHFRAPQSEQLPRQSACCAVAPLGMIWVLETTSEWWGVALYNAVVSLLFAQFTKMLVECKCGQRARGGKFFGIGRQLTSQQLRVRYEYLGYAIMLLVMAAEVASIGPLATYILQNGLGTTLLLSTVVGKLAAWAGVTFWQVLVFSAKFWLQQGSAVYHVTDEQFRAYIERTEAQHRQRRSLQHRTSSQGALGAQLAQRARALVLALHFQPPSPCNSSSSSNSSHRDDHQLAAADDDGEENLKPQLPLRTSTAGQNDVRP